MAKTNLSIPGTVYASRGRLIIKLADPVRRTEDGSKFYHVEHTGLLDNKQGRQLAAERHYKLYRELYLGEVRAGDKPQIRANDAFQAFLESKKIMASTKRGYETAYRVFFKDTNPILSDEKLISAIQHYLKVSSKAGDHNAVTIRTYLRQFHVFVKYLVKKKHVTSEVLEAMEVRIEHDDTREDTVAGRFEPDEIPTLLRACYVISDDFGRMNEFMMMTGARPVDVLTLTWEQVDFDKSTVLWRNKITKKPELRSIHPQALDVLEAQRAATEERGTGKVFKWSHASLSRLSRQFDRAMKIAGLDKVTEGNRKRSLKSWRVVFRAMLHDLPPQLQQWFMRHKSLKVTETNYTYFTTEEQASSIQRITLATPQASEGSD